MKKLIKNRFAGSLRFPTFVGIASLLALLLIINFFGQKFIWGSIAGTQAVPQGVQVTNISGDSFTVSFTTSQAAYVTLDLVSPQKAIYNDIRFDQDQEKREFYTHYIKINNLQISAEYEFMITSNGRTYGQDGKEKGRPFLTRTAPFKADPSLENRLAYGQIIDFQNQAVGGVVVYLNIPEVAPLSSLTSDSGYWMVPFAFAYAPDLTNLANYQEGEVEEEIRVEGGPFGQSEVLNFTRNNKPVLPITLGRNDDFRDLSGASQAQATPTASSGRISLEDQDYQRAGEEFTIINPENGEGVATFRPEVFGTGPLDGQVEVTIESDTIYQGKVDVDEQGFWRYAPPGNLEPGEHTLTAVFTSVLGEKITLKRNFTVLAADNDTAFTATPSGGQVSLTPSPIFTPTPTTTRAPTTTPILTPTLTPSAPTSTPSVPAASPTFSSPTQIPQTGQGIFANAGLFLGIAVLASGLFFIFLL
ncbi:MAG: hypothetical protein ABIB61_03840 [Candidatus Shapirobacteria bacterium]